MTNPIETAPSFTIIDEQHEDRATMVYGIQPPIPLEKVGLVNLSIARQIESPVAREAHGIDGISDQLMHDIQERFTIKTVPAEDDPNTTNVEVTLGRAFDNSHASFSKATKDLLRSIVTESLLAVSDNERPRESV